MDSSKFTEVADQVENNLNQTPVNVEEVESEQPYVTFYTSSRVSMSRRELLSKLENGIEGISLSFTDTGKEDDLLHYEVRVKETVSDPF